MEGVEAFTHDGIECMAVFIDSDVPLFYCVGTVSVVGFVRKEIPDSGNRHISKEMFEEEKLSEVSDITGVTVLQRVALELLWSGCHTAIVDPQDRSCNNGRTETVLIAVAYLFFFILDDFLCRFLAISFQITQYVDYLLGILTVVHSPTLLDASECDVGDVILFGLGSEFEKSFKCSYHAYRSSKRCSSCKT